MGIGARRGVPTDRAVAHRHRAMIRVNRPALSGIARRRISEEHALIDCQSSLGECLDRTALIPACCSPTGQRQLLQRRVAGSKLDGEDSRGVVGVDEGMGRTLPGDCDWPGNRHLAQRQRDRIGDSIREVRSAAT